MKRLVARVVVLSLIGCWFVIGGVFASSSLALIAPAPSAKTITLFEDTSFYDVYRKEVGLLSPQEVTILNTKLLRVGHGEGYLRSFYQISTWMGLMWISPDNAEFDHAEPLITNIDLGSIQAIYDDPGLTQPTGGALAPQIVTTKSKWGSRYLIKTKSGDKWIQPGYLSLIGVKEVDEEVQLPYETVIVRNPTTFQTFASITPQLVNVKEVWRNWHRIDSWIGPVWFKLHELDAVDRNDDVEVGFTYWNFDPSSGSTHMKAEVQLGRKWHDRNEPAQVGFQVLFYSALGERLGVSNSVTTEVATGAGRQVIDLTVNDNISDFEYATVQVGRLFGSIVNDVQPSEPMLITDAAVPELRLGGIQVRRDGIYSVISGQFQLDEATDRTSIKGQLSFIDRTGNIMGTAPFQIQPDTNLVGKDRIYSFESVAPANVLEYSSIKLKINK
ncbi:hypothetical protein GK047_18530 [Paenibacillus sp. SYP-B3998]|uniref:Uncharacterized protein n=1 Tax=Paenibacillus sp. SYP-B3998 TaxID=2678564 RepID=A0A6G4A2F3_9BACL|nr:hypothetical protein [Paenibacillus sp. SYP-B3998]NEW07999.1 hypothetical protein [Paenibacillus sp. SYP-B3998]